MGRQYDKKHSVTKVAAAVIAAHRFVGYDGTHATSAGGLHDSQGISEYEAPVGGATSLITGYSGLVEASEAIAEGDFVKPAADGSGKAAVGSADDYCGRALSAAGGAGQIFECQVLAHHHPAA